MKLEQSVFEAINPTIEGLGYEIVEVEYVKKGTDMHLTVYIDVKSGISLDDCEKVHMAIDTILDELNPTQDKPYVLNVSSPGLDSPFKTQRAYERNYGREVEVKLYAQIKGVKLYEGVLIERTETTTTIETAKENIKIENNKIALVRQLVKFE